MKKGQKLVILEENKEHPFAYGQVVEYRETIAEQLVWAIDEEGRMALLSPHEYKLKRSE